MDKKKLKDYAELKLLEKTVKLQIEELGKEVKEMISEAGQDKVEMTDVGSFTLKIVSVWKYTDAVEEAMKKVDELKADEKARGKAVSSNRVDLVFTALKQKDE
jgi:hypothetical protein